MFEFAYDYSLNYTRCHSLTMLSSLVIQWINPHINFNLIIKFTEYHQSLDYII